MLSFLGHRVLVGGGCGLIGSYLVPALVSAGARVRVVDNLSNGRRESLDPVADAIEFIEGDLGERSTCDRAMPGHDVFINLAASAPGVGFSRTHHGQMLV